MTLKTRAADLATQAIELLDAQIKLLGIRELSEEQVEAYRNNYDRLKDLISLMSSCGGD